MIKKQKSSPVPIEAEPWEVEAVHREFPTHPEKELEPAIKKCKEQAVDPRNGLKLAQCVSDQIK